MTDPVADAIKERVQLLTPNVFDPGKVPDNQAAPYAVLYGGVPAPFDRDLSGGTPRRIAVFRLVVVSNVHDGARTFATQAVDVIDGHRVNDACLTIPYGVSDPLLDRTDPSDTYWSSTIEIHHASVRSLP